MECKKWKFFMEMLIHYVVSDSIYYSIRRIEGLSSNAPRTIYIALGLLSVIIPGVSKYFWYLVYLPPCSTFFSLDEQYLL